MKRSGMRNILDVLVGHLPRLERPFLFWHRCQDCGLPDKALWLTWGKHEYDDGTPHLPF